MWGKRQLLRLCPWAWLEGFPYTFLCPTVNKIFNIFRGGEGPRASNAQKSALLRPPPLEVSASLGVGTIARLRCIFFAHASKVSVDTSARIASLLPWTTICRLSPLWPLIPRGRTREQDRVVNVSSPRLRFETVLLILKDHHDASQDVVAKLALLHAPLVQLD